MANYSYLPSRFGFAFQGAGHYLVTYFRPNSDVFYRWLCTDMSLIDSTRNAEKIVLSKWFHLRKCCIRNGSKIRLTQ